MLLLTVAGGTFNKEVQPHLFKGATASCGCLRSELVATKNRTHGKSATPLYRVWRSMLDRCYREKCPATLLRRARNYCSES